MLSAISCSIRNTIQFFLINFFKATKFFWRSKIVLFSEFMANRDLEYMLTKKGTEKYIVLAHDVGVSRKIYIGKGDEYLKTCKALEVLANARGEQNFPLELLIDVGANLGHILIPMLNHGYAKTAIGFEPDSVNFRLCSANVLINDLAGKVTLHNFALGSSENQILEFELSEDNSGDHRIKVSDSDGAYAEANRKKTIIKSTTLDSFFPSLPSPRSCLIWIDVQGYEGHVLSGAKKFLEQRTPIGLEFWPYGLSRASSFDPLLASLASYGQYIDLGDAEAKPKAIKSLKKLYEENKHTQFTTDILVF